jgi:cell division protein FtsB
MIDDLAELRAEIDLLRDRVAELEAELALLRGSLARPDPDEPAQITLNLPPDAPR